METLVLEGTWEEIVEHAPEFNGRRLRVTVIDEQKPQPDVAVFRDGSWYLNRSTQGFTGVSFGTSTDKPIPNAFVP